VAVGALHENRAFDHNGTWNQSGPQDGEIFVEENAGEIVEMSAFKITDRRELPGFVETASCAGP